jgi:hypothetical protein
LVAIERRADGERPADDVVEGGAEGGRAVRREPLAVARAAHLPPCLAELPRGRR